VVKLKRIAAIAFMLLCLLSLIPLRYNASVNANPDSIHVPADYPTIQQAINHASSGDTILVQNGTYYEHVLINKSLSLIGEGRDLTVVNGSGVGSVISITASDVVVEGFTVMKSGKNAEDSGIHVEHSDGVIIGNNNIRDSTNGISLILSNNNTISGNVFVANSFYAVYLSSSSGNVISDNVISDNYVGVFLFSSTSNIATRNTASDNDYGIFLYSSIDNMILGNNISSNNYGGIYLAFSSNNTIYHNNLNNAIQASSDLANSWNYSGEGNFWSDYNGQDLNGDGIGDALYAISSNNRDSCPLMGIFLSFAVAFQGDLYHIGVISNSTISEFRFEIGAETGNRIIHFNATNTGGATGLCRITIPTTFMSYPYFVLANGEQIFPTTIGDSNQTQITLYFTYSLANQIITIISSEALRFYNELLVQYLQLQADLQALTVQYYLLSDNYGLLISNYSQLQIALAALNMSYQDLSIKYDGLYTSYEQLQLSFNNLNASYYSLSTDFTTLSGNYSQLTSDFIALQKEFNDLNVTNYLLSANFSILLGNYSQLLGESVKLQADFDTLNMTYYKLMSNYTLVLGNFSQLLISFDALNASYQNLLGLNTTYYALLDSFTILSGNYTQLRQDYQGLNASYQAHIVDYAENARNIQNLIYIFVVVTAIFIVTTIYLSKRAHSGAVTRSKARENNK
jgi:parallel beta-helix repeat protein